MDSEYGSEFWERAIKATDEYAALTGEVLQMVRGAESKNAALLGTREGFESLMGVLAALRDVYSAMAGIVPQKGADGRLARPGYDRYGVPPRGGTRPR